MASFTEPNQYTIRRTVSCCGVGLHTGRNVNLALSPAPANTGIRFSRSDLPGSPVIPADFNNVVDTQLATTLGDKDNVCISTTEHLLAALAGMGIDNVEIDVNSHEIPIMDGSAGPFLRLLKQAGRKKQQPLKKVVRITQTVAYTDGDKSIRIDPYEGFKITGRIEFKDALIKEQEYTFEINRDHFDREIAPARTFGFVEEVEHLWRSGLALGGTLDNVIAIHWDRRSILNENGLRFADEFIRHKVLDIIGDMALFGYPLMGHIVAERSGHGLHYEFLRTLQDHPECYEIITLADQEECFIDQDQKPLMKNPLFPVGKEAVPVPA